MSTANAVIIALTMFALAVGPRVALAQAGDPITARPDAVSQATIDRARSMADRGEGIAARAVLDTLIDRAESGSPEFAEALYWRAVLSDRATDAERDWKRLTVEASFSPRVPDALLWLGELELVRGHGATARGYLEQLLLDFSGAVQRPKATLWIARSYFDERDFARACATVARARSAGVPDGELRLQSEDMARRCTTLSATGGALAPIVTLGELESKLSLAATIPDVSVLDSTIAPKPNRGPYSVQLAAFATREEAQRAMERSMSLGISLRIDGTRKPFRLRSGRYATRAAASKAVAALKKRGVTAIVVDNRP